MRRTPAPTDPTAVRDDGLEALEALANEHRIAILRVLADAEKPLAFSELRERVGIRDTGKFNYHLTEVLGRFVRERADGYELGHAGKRVVLAAGDIEPDHLAVSGESTEFDCPVCGESDCEKLIHVHLSSG